MPCSALNCGCGIKINSEQLTGTAKWEHILKLYETDKQNVLHHSCQCDAQIPGLWSTEYDQSELGCASHE
jgi:hypothetical protein